MTESFEKMGQEAAAFQKLFVENLVKSTQAAFDLAPESARPEMLRQMRAGIFQSLSESWDEYLRSPQFLDGMRQWMDNAVAFRKISNEYLGRVRNEMQAPSRTDIDTVMLAVRHMEKRLLDRLDELSARVDQALSQKAEAKAQAAPRGNGRKAARSGRAGGPTQVEGKAGAK